MTSQAINETDAERLAVAIAAKLAAGRSVSTRGELIDALRAVLEETGLSCSDDMVDDIAERVITLSPQLWGGSA